MPDLLLKSEIKARRRTQARRRRAAIPAADARRAAQKIAASGLAFLHLAREAVIAGYYPAASELDSLPLLHRLAACGFRLALPVIEPGFTLSFAAWTPAMPVEIGAYGIPRPAGPREPLQPDVLLAPLLAFDARGFRLGHGGGYYDRALSALRLRGKIIAVGLAFDEQEAQELPCEPHDQRLDWVLTPSGPRHFGG